MRTFAPFQLKVVPLVVGFLVAALGAVSPAQAQVSPTPEGTVITNTATATWTDDNNNSYDPVSASVSVTVGFQAGVDVTAPAAMSPSTPSTGNEFTFNIANGGNGIDQFSISTTAGTGLTITGYRVDGTVYETIAELNAALVSKDVAAGSSLSVVVIYDVSAGTAEQTMVLSLTATSVRDPEVSDTDSTSATPPLIASVSVSPDGATVSRLPSNGTQYTASFDVSNGGNASDLIGLSVSTDNSSVLSIVSINGSVGNSASITLGSGASQSITVVYTIADDAAEDATASLQLTATSGNDSGESDNGDFTVTVVRPAISMAMAAYKNDGVTLIGGDDRVLPGQTIQYKVTVTNEGSADAVDVKIGNPVPAQVIFQSTSADAAGWTLTETAGTVVGELDGTLASGASRFFWIVVMVR